LHRPYITTTAQHIATQHCQLIVTAQSQSYSRSNNREVVDMAKESTAREHDRADTKRERELRGAVAERCKAVPSGATISSQKKWTVTAHGASASNVNSR
jgi:predicted outer membrane protein